METATAVPAPAPSDERKARRTYLIDKGFQLKYTVIIVAIGSAISLLFGFWMYRVQRENTELLGLTDPALKEAVARIDAQALIVFLGIALLMAAALGLFGVLITHRVAGPVYVIRQYLDTIEAGRYPTIRPLRKGDDLQEFFDSFSRAVDALKKRDRKDADLMDQAIAELSAFHAARPDMMSAEVEAELEALRKVRDRKLARLADQS